MPGESGTDGASAGQSTSADAQQRSGDSERCSQSDARNCADSSDGGAVGGPDHPMMHPKRSRVAPLYLPPGSLDRKHGTHAPSSTTFEVAFEPTDVGMSVGWLVIEIEGPR